MKTFRVSGAVTVSCWTYVDAENADEALKIACCRDLAEIHIDGTYENTECFHIETDGTPQNLTVEEDT